MKHNKTRRKKPRPTQASRSPYMGEARARVQGKKFKNQGAREGSGELPYSGYYKDPADQKPKAKGQKK